MLDFALQEFDVLEAALAFVLFGEREHLVGHVEAVGLPRRADAARGEQHVDPQPRLSPERSEHVGVTGDVW